MAPSSCNEWSRILYSTLRVPIKFVWVMSRRGNAVLKAGNPTTMLSTRFWVKFSTTFCTMFSLLVVFMQALQCCSVNWYFIPRIRLVRRGTQKRVISKAWKILAENLRFEVNLPFFSWRNIVEGKCGSSHFLHLNGGSLLFLSSWIRAS